MRERSTWNRDEVQKKVAGLQGKQADLNKKADPYTMNQDHPQPAADKYVTGDPSTFAEDVHTPNTWDVEYKGDEVKRDEIGMADYRPDTFNHSEKTAAQRETLHKKAKLCVAVARLMLAGQKTASIKAIEDQAYALMYMPDEALISTHKRLANEQGDDDGDDEGKRKQAQDQDDKGQEQQAKQAQDQQDDKGQEQAKQAQQDEKKDEPAQEQAKQAADDQNEKANKNWPTKEASLLVGQVVASLQAGNFKVAQEQIQQLVQQQTAGMDQQQLANQIQQMIQQAMGQQQMPPAQQAQQQMPQVQVSDEQVLDQMLAQDSCGPMAEVDIQMDPAQMDVLAGELGPEDEALRTLFAQDDETQDQGGEQQKQAGMARTASSRTVGTRPTAGVAKLGGAGAPGNGGTDLSSLWQSAPDVRDVFGMGR